MGGLFLLGGVASGLFLLFPVILVLALLVILALRHDDDVDGGRAPAIYGAIIAFVGLLTLLFAITGVVSSLASLTRDSLDGNGPAISSAIGFLIAGAAALGLLAVHRPLFEQRRSLIGAAARVHRAYLLVLCLVTALIAMLAAGLGAYALYRSLFPGTAGADSRGDELRTLATLLVLFLGAGSLWRFHWRELDLFSAPPATAP